MIDQKKELMDYRYERKFCLPCLKAEEVLPFLKNHPLRFREAYPQRTVNNIYFDSIDHDTYWMHVNGHSKRFKLRLRWYGALRGSISAGALELKIKENHLGRKFRYDLPSIELDNSFSLCCLRKLCREADIALDIQELVAGSQFSVFTRYDRRYFCSANGVFRITLDANLRFLPIKACLNDLSQHPSVYPHVIMELKYDREFDERAREVTDALPFRLGRVSKFVSGVQAVHIH